MCVNASFFFLLIMFSIKGNAKKGKKRVENLQLKAIKYAKVLCSKWWWLATYALMATQNDCIYKTAV